MPPTRHGVGAATGIRFAAYAPGVSSALLGTRSPARIISAAEHVEKGPLPDDIVADIHRRFAAHGSGGRWPGVI